MTNTFNALVVRETEDGVSTSVEQLEDGDLPDGDVEVLAQGAQDALETLVAEVRRGPRYSHVDRCAVERQASDERFDSFEVRY